MTTVVMPEAVMAESDEPALTVARVDQELVGRPVAGWTRIWLARLVAQAREQGLDPVGQGQKRWISRWKATLDALDTAFEGRLSADYR
jgi:hypothetical protein